MLAHLKVFIVEPGPPPPKGGFCGTPRVSYTMFINALTSAHEQATRPWTLLPASQALLEPDFEPIAQQQWADWLEGRPGCWAADAS